MESSDGISEKRNISSSLQVGPKNRYVHVITVSCYYSFTNLT